ncbi:Histone-lysine N-methyltransferase ash1 [Colletotrichum siamense]|uniref:Histone-lysine N-methyltransferase ash1 n=1 Tax=Colletotrichum siamense TaxID=690259 RepID=UPI001872E5D1|nr:Histone-lysine N-methyltransferase ash1 [Colletotrichum siamense]KAF5511797.1 Histone-lysine N-methyltransferase ash1 [Colletotrichum siamense]
MAPLTPHWTQPSHPDIQDVIKASETEFLTKSFSKVALPPFAVYAKMSFPPCDLADEPTYATVQCGKDKHLNLNSDLLYINHSCEPSLIFDTGNFNVLAGPKGLQPGDELTFFYPSTEWHMAQPFDCFCGTPSCRGRIAGARDMPRAQLEGLWLNGHIRELLDERDSGRSGNDDPTAQALRDALKAAERVVEAARSALRTYTESSSAGGNNAPQQAQAPKNGVNGSKANGSRNGASARELGGELGGDTTA